MLVLQLLVAVDAFTQDAEVPVQIGREPGGAIAHYGQHLRHYLTVGMLQRH